MISEERIRRLLKVLSVFLSFTAVVCALIMAAKAAQPAKEKTEEYYYVACKDKRIYTIDIGLRQVATISDPIPELGKPTCMDISWDGKTLYIGSEMGHWQTDYFPIVAVDMETMKVKRKFYLERDSKTGVLSLIV